MVDVGLEGLVGLPKSSGLVGFGLAQGGNAVSPYITDQLFVTTITVETGQHGRHLPVA